MLARLVDPPDWSTQDKAEATAKATRTRLRGELLPHMVGHANALVRNTAEFFSGASPLLKLDAITKRSDSDAKMAKPPAGYDATLYDAFFLGTSMDNVDYHQKAMTGTLSGTTMYLRGHDMTGAVESLDTMAFAVTHEVSHFLVKQYGELPETDKDAASFDRYADEFRAYWVQPNSPGGPGLSDADKAKAIREHQQVNRLKQKKIARATGASGPSTSPARSISRISPSCSRPYRRMTRSSSTARTPTVTRAWR